MTQELNVYAICPDGTAIYIPELLAGHLRIARGQRLTEGQYASNDIQGLLARRVEAQKRK